MAHKRALKLNICVISWPSWARERDNYSILCRASHSQQVTACLRLTKHIFDFVDMHRSISLRFYFDVDVEKKNVCEIVRRFTRDKRAINVTFWSFSMWRKLAIEKTREQKATKEKTRARVEKLTDWQCLASWYLTELLLLQTELELWHGDGFVSIVTFEIGKVFAYFQLQFRKFWLRLKTNLGKWWESINIVEFPISDWLCFRLHILKLSQKSDKN